MGWMTTPDGREGAVGFAESYHTAGGDCTVINLPDLGVTGNSHFMFQEENNSLIANYIAAWIESRGLNCNISLSDTAFPNPDTGKSEMSFFMHKGA